MNSIHENFNEVLTQNNPTCSEEDLREFINYGLILESNKKYYTKDGRQINLNIYKPNSLNINLSNLIGAGITLAKSSKCNRIYFMTQRCYDKYKEQGRIIHMNNQNYYRMYNKEEWLINII